MTDHRKTPVSSALTLPLWFIVVSLAACLGATAYLGYLLVDDRQDTAASRPASATAAAPTAAAPTTAAPTTEPPTPEPSSEPTPKPTPEPTPTPEPEPEPTQTPRSAAVAVFNQSGVGGRAASAATTIRGKGWEVAGVGNWRGTVASNTVYYPSDLQAQAERLGADVGIPRVLPRTETMRSDRLTVVLTSAL